MKKALLLSLLSVVILSLGSCASEPEEQQIVDTIVKNEVSNDTNPVAPDTSSVKEFEIDSFTEVIDGKYNPQFSIKELNVKKWDTVRLRISAKGTHDFKIDELGVFSDTPDGEVTVIEFTADKVWEFVYWCTQPNHRKNGHWGTIIITE